MIKPKRGWTVAGSNEGEPIGLSLEPLTQAGPGDHVAQMVVEFRHGSMQKSIGAPELLFLHLLVQSNRPVSWNGDIWTIVEIGEVRSALKTWAGARYLAYGQSDHESPRVPPRISKYWYVLKSSVASEARLRSLVDTFSEPGRGTKLYGLHLPPDRLTSRLPTIAQLFGPRRRR
jgi:hypothetical protein